MTSSPSEPVDESPAETVAASAQLNPTTVIQMSARKMRQSRTVHSLDRWMDENHLSPWLIFVLIMLSSKFTKSNSIRASFLKNWFKSTELFIYVHPPALSLG